MSFLQPLVLMAVLSANPSGPPELMMAQAVGDNIQFELRHIVQVPVMRTREEQYTVNKAVTELVNGKKTVRIVPEVRTRKVNYTTMQPQVTLRKKLYPVTKIAAVSTDQKLLDADVLKNQLSGKRPVLVIFSDFDLDPEFLRLFGPGQLILKVNETRNNFLISNAGRRVNQPLRPIAAPQVLPAQQLVPAPLQREK